MASERYRLASARRRDKPTLADPTVPAPAVELGEGGVDGEVHVIAEAEDRVGPTSGTNAAGLVTVVGCGRAYGAENFLVSGKPQGGPELLTAKTGGVDLAYIAVRPVVEPLDSAEAVKNLGL